MSPRRIRRTGGWRFASVAVGSCPAPSHVLQAQIIEHKILPLQEASHRLQRILDPKSPWTNLVRRWGGTGSRLVCGTRASDCCDDTDPVREVGIDETLEPRLLPRAKDKGACVFCVGWGDILSGKWRVTQKAQEFVLCCGKRR